jgi:gamma-glutamyltranspeptidase/glutathione hydrolase
MGGCRAGAALAYLLAATFFLVVAAGPAAAAFPRPARGEAGMVASAHPLATEAGQAVLKAGGNAVDAAIATAFVISVVEPYSAGIGGGGFAVLHLADEGEVKALDFRERAPAAATRDMYLKDDGTVDASRSVDGYLSVAVPGTVAGLAELHAAHGKLPWRRLLAPAIKLARNGFEIDEAFAASLEWRKEVLLRFPESRALFAPGGELLREGARLRQKDLASTLGRISNNWRDFYRGRTARLMAADMVKNGGLVSAEDLRRYKPLWREPVCGAFRAHRVCSMPPPSSGGVHLLEILNLVAPTDLEGLGWHHPDAIHQLVEAMRIAYADRSEWLGDPAFSRVPASELSSPAYAERRRKEIDARQARRSADVRPASREQLGWFKESQDTTHLTVVDEKHNAVAMTFTVNYDFGSGVVVPGTGVLMNDEMDDFAAAPGQPNVYGLVGGDANAVEAKKTPLSSMTPFVVSKEGKLRMAGGSPGGSTIITTSLQLILHVLVYGMDAGAAVAAPRLHHQWLPDELRLEAHGFDARTKEELEKRGHRVKERRGWGNATLIVVDEEGRLEGAADPRGVGSAAGL